MFDMSPPKPPDPRKLTYGAPPPESKLVIVHVTKQKDDDRLGCYLEAYETEMEQKRPIIVREVADGMLAKAAGIWPLDVIRYVNGHEVSTPKGALELFTRAQLKRPIEASSSARRRASRTPPLTRRCWPSR